MNKFAKIRSVTTLTSVFVLATSVRALFGAECGDIGNTYWTASFSAPCYGLAVDDTNLHYGWNYHFSAFQISRINQFVVA